MAYIALITSILTLMTVTVASVLILRLLRHWSVTQAPVALPPPFPLDPDIADELAKLTIGYLKALRDDRIVVVERSLPNNLEASSPSDETEHEREKVLIEAGAALPYYGDLNESNG